MKKVVILFLLFLLCFSVSAFENELVVRFYSYGKTATIDLVKYLGRSENYYFTPTPNVSIAIKDGTAFLAARPGWEGVETIIFTTKEHLYETKNLTFLRMFPVPPEIIEKYPILETPPEKGKYRIVTDEELLESFSDTVTPSIWKKLPKGEIETINTEIKENEIIVDVNDANLKIDLEGNVPKVNINLNLKEKEKRSVKIIKKFNYLNLIWIPVGLIAIYLIFLLVKHVALQGEYKPKKESKKMAIKGLKVLKNNIDENTTKEFLRILKAFFSEYFNIEDFTFVQLKNKIKGEPIEPRTKIELLNIINKIIIMAFCAHTEKWANIYDMCKIPKTEVKQLISKTISAIKKL